MPKTKEIKLIMPKHSSSVDYFRLSLKVCAAHPDGILIENFKDELFNELKLAGLETVKNRDDSYYSQCLQLPRYFGFVRYCLSNERGNAITARGRAMLSALSSKPADVSSIISLLFDAIVQNYFGRKNEGVETNSYCEPLAILFRAADRLNGISNSEFGYLIEQMDQNGRPFRKVIEEIQRSRSEGMALPIEKGSQADEIQDWKTILWMVNIGFLAKDGQGRVTISSSIPEEKKHRLNALPLYNPGFLKWLFILNLKKSQLDQSVENYPRSLEAMSGDFGEKNSSKFDGFFKRLTGHLPRKKVFEVLSLSEYDSVFEELNYFWDVDESKGFSPFAEDRFYECYYYAKAKNKIDNGRLYSACNSYRNFLKWFDANYNDFDIDDADFQIIEGDSVEVLIPLDDLPLQRIFYGAPGTGKSYHTDALVKKYSDTIRVTFHPDSDYASFAGCYKPTMKAFQRVNCIDDKAKLVKNADGTPSMTDAIVYEFVPQAFTKAYELAWRKMSECKDGGRPAPQFLVVEEINRGNCAQIFGDLFQLLDRDDNGYSKYPVDPDADLAKHLHDWFRGDYVNGDGTESPTIVGDSDGDKWKARKAGSGESDATWADVLAGRKLVLPPNLHVWATMNTSDQSLFPIDSAFKRRWDWEYVPIDDAKKGWAIVADGKRFDWWAFLEKANEAVRKATGSEDKELGYFFVKPPVGLTDIPPKTFVDKVLFYLFGDAFKDDTPPLSLFPKKSDGAGAWTLRDFRENVLEGGSAKSKPNEKNLAAWLEQIKINPPGKPESASDGGDATASAEPDASQHPAEAVKPWGRLPASSPPSTQP